MCRNAGLSVAGPFVVLLAVLLSLAALSQCPGLPGVVASGAVLAVCSVLYVRAVRPPPARRPAADALAEVDRLDAQEAPEEAFQPLFDELLLHGPELDAEIVRRMNHSPGPSRRMFLQLAAVHDRLAPALRELAASDHPLAPEAKGLLERHRNLI